MAGERILETLQKIATAVHRLDRLTEDLRELRTTVTARLEKLEGQLADVRERWLGWKHPEMPAGRRCKLTWHGSGRRWNEQS